MRLCPLLHCFNLEKREVVIVHVDDGEGDIIPDIGDVDGLDLAWYKSTVIDMGGVANELA